MSDAVATDNSSRNSLLPPGRHKWGEVVATTVIGAAVMLPLLEPLGWFDHWPSWGLYAPRNSRCHLYVDGAAVEKLSDVWRQGLISSVDVQHGWSPGLEIPLSRQSLELLDVPIYPQDRFQLGAAIAIARRFELGDEAYVVWESSSNRISGRRRRETFHGLKEIEAAADRFWLNVEPRAATR